MSESLYLDVAEKTAISTDTVLKVLGVLLVLLVLLPFFFRKNHEPPTS